MRIEKLIYFLDLYEYRNYTKVAQRNYISQTSLTQFINSLEAEFDVKLFDRSTQPIKPTPAGDRFYKEARILYKQYQFLSESMDNMKKHPGGSLKIKYTSPIDLQMFGPFIAIFQEKHPEIMINLSKTSFRLSAPSLVFGESDVVIGLNLPLELVPNVKILTPFEGEFLIVASENHPLSKLNTLTSKDLEGYPFIMLSKEIVGETAYQEMLERCSQDGFYPKIEKIVDDYETMLFYISVENLISFLPDGFKLRNYDYRLKKLPLANNRHKYQVNIGYNTENPVAVIFAKELSEYIKSR